VRQLHSIPVLPLPVPAGSGACLPRPRERFHRPASPGVAAVPGRDAATRVQAARANATVPDLRGLVGLTCARPLARLAGAAAWFQVESTAMGGPRRAAQARPRGVSASARADRCRGKARATNQSQPSVKHCREHAPPRLRACDSDRLLPLLAGIGIRVETTDRGEFAIDHVHRNGAAERNGNVKEGDVIDTIDGRPVNGLKLSELGVWIPWAAMHCVLARLCSPCPKLDSL
jgi:hypothetical protein